MANRFRSALLSGAIPHSVGLAPSLGVTLPARQARLARALPPDDLRRFANDRLVYGIASLQLGDGDPSYIPFQLVPPDVRPK